MWVNVDKWNLERKGGRGEKREGKEKVGSINFFSHA